MTKTCMHVPGKLEQTFILLHLELTLERGTHEDFGKHTNDASFVKRFADTCVDDCKAGTMCIKMVS